jgi:integrase
MIRDKSRKTLASAPVPSVMGADAHPRNRQPSLEGGVDSHGHQKLIIVYPRPGGDKPLCLNFAPWLERGEFGIAVAKGFAEAWGLASSEKSRIAHRVQLLSLLRFLREYDPAATLKTAGDFKPKEFTAFERYLDKSVPSERTRKKIWATCCRLLKVIDATESMGGTNREPISIPKNRWPGSSKREMHTPALTLDDAGRILRACMQDMQSTLEIARQQTYSDYPGPKLRELVPFVVAMGFWTNFNPDTLVSLRLSKIQPNVLGRILVVGEKGRSNRDQIASFSARDRHICAPPEIISNLRNLTESVRAIADPGIQDFLFIGRKSGSRGSGNVCAFSQVGAATRFYYQSSFSKRHGLAPFSLQMIRATGAKIINALFGDDVKTVQVLLNHLSGDTTDRSYTKHHALPNEELNLADQMEKRNRFVKTAGARDVRGMPSATQSAATPGFACADPFNPPPELGQEPGMCGAYGACVDCPLAGVDRLCATSFALLMRLKNQIVDAKNDPRMCAYRWSRLWKPRLDRLNSIWLPRFPQSVVDEAARTINEVRLVPILDLVQE